MRPKEMLFWALTAIVAAFFYVAAAAATSDTFLAVQWWFIDWFDEAASNYLPQRLDTILIGAAIASVFAYFAVKEQQHRP